MKKKLEPQRSVEEAWDLVLENQGLLKKRLAVYLRRMGTQIAWYRGPDLEAELISAAQEAFFRAALLWDSSKGKLSSYAIPSIDRAMYHEVNKLQQMGGTYKGGRKHMTSAPLTDALDQPMVLDGQEWDIGLADLVAQPWEDGENSFEDALLDELDRDRLIEAIREIVDEMPEPHRSTFRLVRMTDPPADRQTYTSRQGWTLTDAAEQLDTSIETVRNRLTEADEYVLWQLKAKGFENPFRGGEDAEDRG